MPRSDSFERALIVGASLAGIAAAHRLRANGFRGEITIAGDEPDAPYDRPPLSKQVLRGLYAPQTTLPQRRDLKAKFRLGTAATKLNIEARTVRFADGGRLDYTRLLIATGARARLWPNRQEAALQNVFTLRTQRDAACLAATLAGRPQRVLIIGGGFIGCEVASSCREMNLPVTLLVREPVPLVGAVGAPVGSFIAKAAIGKGVALRLHAQIDRLEGDAYGRVAAVILKTGERIAADCVVVALGAIRNVEWLQDSGLFSDAAGLRCDAFCRATRLDGSVAPGVFAAGDVALWPCPHYGGKPVAVEHWGNAVAQGETAARNMLARDESGMVAHDHLPDFWSQQFGLNIKLVGLPTGAESFALVQGSMEENRFIGVYGLRGRTIAAVSVDSARWLPVYRAAIVKGTGFPPFINALDQPSFRFEHLRTR